MEKEKVMKASDILGVDKKAVRKASNGIDRVYHTRI